MSQSDGLSRPLKAGDELFVTCPGAPSPTKEQWMLESVAQFGAILKPSPMQATIVDGECVCISAAFLCSVTHLDELPCFCSESQSRDRHLHKLSGPHSGIPARDNEHR